MFSAAIAAALFTTGIAAGQPQSTGSRDSLLWVQHAIQTAFPELKGRHCTLALTIGTGLDSDWSGTGTILLKVYEADSWRGQPPILEGRSDAMPGSESLHLEGPLLTHAAFEEARKEAEAHPSWTDADLLNLLRRAGAKFPGDDREAFMRHLDVQRFAAILGKITEVEVKFLWRGPAHLPREQQILGLCWEVRVSAATADNRVRKYLLAFEPMHGRLTWLLSDDGR